jgi:hypothetical protein
MAFQVQDILSRALVLLQDADATRWPLTELLGWLNDGLREIVILKPNANSKTMSMSLVQGTRQTIPDTAHALLDVVRNLSALSVGGEAVTPVMRADMDAALPGWHTAAALPFSDKVIHVITDSDDQRTFHVVPGNTGSGYLEIIASVIPATIAPPDAQSDIAAYTATVDVQDVYQNALLDYVLYRAFDKDRATPSAAARALTHYQAFMSAMGNKARGEALANVNRPATPPAA